MPNLYACEYARVSVKGERSVAARARLYWLLLAVALCLLVPKLSQCQEATSSVSTDGPAGASVSGEMPPAVSRRPLERRPVESEIAVTGMIPDGDFRMFSATDRCNAWTVAVEYDRHSWGRLLKARWDYVAEVIPFMLLSQPTKSDFWGNAISPTQELVPGVSISPFGMRFLWRSNRAVQPFVSSTLGAAVFTTKAMSQKASYANFNVQADFGVQVRLTERVDLRVDPFSFFHVSNGYLAASNPGMDELATKIGISYHLRSHRE